MEPRERGERDREREAALRWAAGAGSEYRHFIICMHMLLVSVMHENFINR